MSGNLLFKLYELLNENKYVTFKGVMKSGFDGKTAFELMQMLVSCGALVETADRGVLEVKYGELNAFMHSKNLWIEDSEDYLELKKRADTLSLTQVFWLKEAIKNDGVFQLDGDISDDKLLVLEKSVEQGIFSKTSEKTFLCNIPLFAVRKLVCFADEKLCRFLTYIFASVREVIRFKEDKDKRKAFFRENCEFYGIFPDLDLDYLDYKEEDVAHLDWGDRHLFDDLIEGVTYSVSARNFAKLDLNKVYRYPDDENGATEMTDVMLGEVLEKMLRIAAAIKADDIGNKE